MLGVVRIYGQEPPHCCNTGILEGAEVSVLMTNVLGTNLSNLPPQRYDCRNIRVRTSTLCSVILAVAILGGALVKDECT